MQEVNPQPDFVALLFGPVGAEGAKLFVNKADLAQEIISGGSFAPYKDFNSVQAALSPVLNGKRPFRADLANLVFAAARRRAGLLGESIDSVCIEDLGRTLGSEVRGVRCDRLEYTTLLRLVRSASSLVALAPTGVLGDLCGYEVFRAMIERSRQLMEPEYSGADQRFWFLCSSEEASAQVWRWALVTWQRVAGCNSATALAQLQAAETRGLITVVVAPEESFLFPGLLINPATPGAAHGFHVEMLGDESASICRMSQDSLHRWQSNVFLRLCLGSFGRPIPLASLNLLKAS